MGIRDAYMEHTEVLDADRDIVLKPAEGESYRIQNVRVASYNALESFLELKIDRTTVGYFLVEVDGQNHLRYNKRQDIGYTLLDEMRGRGYEIDYPVASGQEFVLKNVISGVRVKVEYSIYDAGDQKKDMPNGSEALEYFQINFGYRSVAEMEAGKYNLLDKSFLPAELANFPFGEAVPSNTEIDVLGICGIPSYFGRTTNKTVYTTRIKLMRGREILFTKQEDGFVFEPYTKTGTIIAFNYGDSQLGFGDNIAKERVFWLPAPLTFKAGEELSVFVKLSADVTATGATANDKAIRLAIIERIRRLT